MAGNTLIQITFTHTTTDEMKLIIEIPEFDVVMDKDQGTGVRHYTIDVFNEVSFTVYDDEGPKIKGQGYLIDGGIEGSGPLNFGPFNERKYLK